MHRRDAMRRLSGITTGIAVATATAVGILGVYVGKALPGHHSQPATGTAATGNTGQSTGATSSSAQSGINPPSTPTQGTSGSAPVVTGAS